MILAQLAPEATFTPASIIAALAYFAVKHIVFDPKRNRKEDKQEEEKTQLLRDLNHKVATQIIASDARRQAMEKLVDERHSQNSNRLDAIEHALPMACRYRRNG